MTDALQFSVVVALKRTENRGVTVSKTSKLNYEADIQVARTHSISGLKS